MWVRDFWAPPFGRRRLGARTFGRRPFGRRLFGRRHGIIANVNSASGIELIIATYQLIKMMRVSFKSKLDEIKLFLLNIRR